MVKKICWHCGHYAFGCFLTGSVDFGKSSEDSCGKWVPEGARGTVTDMTDGVGSDGTSWSENEYLRDDESNL